MNNQNSLMLKAFIVNFSLYGVIYGLSFSMLNVLNLVQPQYLPLNALLILVMCVGSRDVFSYVKKNAKYIGFIASMCAFSLLVSDLIPGTMDKFSLLGLALSPVVLASLVVRTFDVKGNDFA